MEGEGKMVKRPRLVVSEDAALISSLTTHDNDGPFTKYGLCLSRFAFRLEAFL